MNSKKKLGRMNRKTVKEIRSCMWRAKRIYKLDREVNRVLRSENMFGWVEIKGVEAGVKAKSKPEGKCDKVRQGSDKGVPSLRVAPTLPGM